MHLTWCMAERVGCTHPLRSFRLPPVAEPIPLLTSGKVLIPLNVSVAGLPIEALATNYAFIKAPLAK
jgi:hypothetical protein